MKKMLILLVCFFAIYAELDYQNFIKANNYYNEGKYQEAINLYETIKNKDSSVLFNLGNSYYKLTNYMEAIGYWKKFQKKTASVYDFSLADHNISLALKKMNISIELNLYDKFCNYLIKYSLYFNVLYLQIIFLIFWYLIIFYNMGLLNFKKNIVIFLFILEAIIFIFIYINYSFHFTKTALIKNENTILYAGPSEEYHELKTINKAQEVKIISQVADWFKIYYDHNSSWLKRDDLTLL